MHSFCTTSIWFCFHRFFKNYSEIQSHELEGPSQAPCLITAWTHVSTTRIYNWLDRWRSHAASSSCFITDTVDKWTVDSGWWCHAASTSCASTISWPRDCGNCNWFNRRWRHRSTVESSQCTDGVERIRRYWMSNLHGKRSRSKSGVDSLRSYFLPPMLDALLAAETRVSNVQERVGSSHWFSQTLPLMILEMWWKLKLFAVSFLPVRVSRISGKLRIYFFRSYTILFNKMSIKCVSHWNLSFTEILSLQRAKMT